MSKITYDPKMCYIVEVWFKRGGQGDIAIAYVSAKKLPDGRYDLPKERHYAWGFKIPFWTYESAIRYAHHVADELGIPAVV